MTKYEQLTELVNQSNADLDRYLSECSEALRLFEEAFTRFLGVNSPQQIQLRVVAPEKADSPTTRFCELCEINKVQPNEGFLRKQFCITVPPGTNGFVKFAVSIQKKADFIFKHGENEIPVRSNAGADDFEPLCLTPVFDSIAACFRTQLERIVEGKKSGVGFQFCDVRVAPPRGS